MGKKKELFTLIVLSFAVGFSFFERLSISFMFSYIQTDFGLKQTHLGMVSSAISLTVAFSGILLSRYIDEFGKKKSLVLLLPALGIGSFIESFAPNFSVLIVMRLILGLIIGLFVPTCLSLMAEHAKESHRGLYMGIVQGTSVALIASTIAPVLLIKLSETIGWRYGFRVLLLPCLLLTFLIMRYLEEDPPPAEQEEMESSSSAEGNEQTIWNKNVILCFLISVCLLTWYLNLATFVPSFLKSENGGGLSSESMSIVSMGMGIGGAIWGILVPWSSDFIGRKKVVCLFSVMSMLSPILIMTKSFSPLALLILLSLVHAGQGVLTLSISTVPSESVSPENSAKVIGMIAGGGELVGGVLMPLALGFLAERFTNFLPIIVCGIVVLVAAILSLGLTETRKKSTN